MRLQKECCAPSLRRLGKENMIPDAPEGPNLLWLLNFRLDNFISGETNTSQVNTAPKEPEESAVSIKPPVKPPFTYTELIEQALTEQGPLTVAEIYRWISDRFPYFRPNDDRWKNSVRHNLSISPHFRKSVKAKTGTGHLWALALPGGRLNTVWTRGSVGVALSSDVGTDDWKRKGELDNSLCPGKDDETARACLELLRAENMDSDYVACNEKVAENVVHESFLFGTSACGHVFDLETATEEFSHPSNHDTQSNIPGFLNPVPRHEIVYESGLLNLSDNLIRTYEEQEDQFDPFRQSESNAVLFGEDLHLTYAYEIL